MQLFMEGSWYPEPLVLGKKQGYCNIFLSQLGFPEADSERKIYVKRFMKGRMLEEAGQEPEESS